MLSNRFMWTRERTQSQKSKFWLLAEKDVFLTIMFPENVSLSNNTKQFWPHSENSSFQGNKSSVGDVLQMLCYQFVTGEVVKSIPLSVFWFTVAVVSFCLNALELRFFIRVTKVHKLHEMLLANQLICHLSIGFCVQLAVGVIYFYDNCLLRILCHVSSIVMTNVSIITSLFLTLNQLSKVTLNQTNLMISKAKGITTIVFVWLYCIC